MYIEIIEYEKYYISEYQKYMSIKKGKEEIQSVGN